MRALTSENTAPKVIGQADSLLRFCIDPSESDSSDFAEWSARMKEIIAATADATWTVLVLPQISCSKEIETIVQKFSETGIRLHAVLGRAAIAEKVAAQAALSQPMTTWFLDAMPDALLLRKLDGTTSAQNYEFAFHNWIVRRHGQIRNVFKELARVELREIGGTPYEIERWMMANEEAIWRSDAPVEWCIGAKRAAKVHPKNIRDKLVPLSDEFVQRISEFCMPTIQQGDKLLIDEALVQRMPTLDLLAKAMPHVTIEALRTQKCAIIASWTNSQQSVLPHMVLWADRRLDGVERCAWKSPQAETIKEDQTASSYIERVSRLERMNRYLIGATAVMICLTAVSLFWRPSSHKSSSIANNSGGSFATLESRIQKLEDTVANMSEQIASLRKNSTTSGETVTRLESSLEAQRRATESQLTNLQQRILAATDSRTSFDSLTTKELKVLDSTGNLRVLMGTDADGGKITVLNSQGTVALVFDVNSGAGTVVVNDKRGNTAVFAGMNDGGRGLLKIMNESGKGTVAMASDINGDGVILMMDKLERNLVKIESLSGDGFIEVLDKQGNSAVQVDGQNRRIWSANYSGASQGTVWPGK